MMRASYLLQFKHQILPDLFMLCILLSSMLQMFLFTFANCMNIINSNRCCIFMCSVYTTFVGMASYSGRGGPTNGSVYVCKLPPGTDETMLAEYFGTIGLLKVWVSPGIVWKPSL